MENQQFKTGDVVQMKSGGPKMTVSYIDEDLMVKCVYFITNTEKYDFTKCYHNMLELVKE